VSDERRPLVIPDFGDTDVDLLTAALRYAGEGGFYVGPLAVRDKNPGAMLGKKWQAFTRNDADGIGVWYLLDDAGGVFLHCGRSGALMFDVDHPEKVPTVLAKYLWLNPEDPVAERIPAVPFQSSRPDVPGKGHYLFLQPPDRMLGNGTGKLGDDWGEVRGKNGVIVVYPTVHESEAEGAAYRWVRTGALPPLPEEIRDLLPNADRDVDSAPDDVVRAFLDTFESNERPEFRDAPFERWQQSMSAGASRHQTCLKVLCWIVRDAGQRLYPARPAIQQMYDLFMAAMDARPTRGRFPRAEFQSMLAYAVGDALAQDLDARREALEQRLAAKDAEKGIRPVTDEERQQRAEEAKHNALDTGGVAFDPDKYFWDKSIGLDVSLLAKDIMEIGPLAKGIDGVTWSYRDGVWRLHKDAIEERCVALLGRRYRNSHVTNVTAVIKAQIPVIACDPVHAYLNTRSGMVDWETGEIRPHSPDYFSTVQFPWEWEPGATCPRFDKFLEDILSPDYVTLVWQMIGYLLYSGNPRQVAFMLLGAGNNGKGTLMRVLSALLGGANYATETLTQLNTNKFAAINLYGMIANLAGDIDAKYQEDTAMFKTLTGEDMVSGERKFGDRIKFFCWAVPVFSANKTPGSADTSKGYTRRWKIVRFERELSDSEVIPGYSDLLIEELPGIAAKALGYLRDVIGGGFKDDGDIAQGQEDFEREIDQVRQWVDECTEPAATAVEERSAAYKSYRLWADSTGVSRLKASEFFVRLTAAGFPAGKVHGGTRVHRGLVITQFRVQGALAMTSAHDDEPSDPFAGASEERADA
jgi:putative DNA primase/helicase